MQALAILSQEAKITRWLQYAKAFIYNTKPPVPLYGRYSPNFSIRHTPSLCAGCTIGPVADSKKGEHLMKAFLPLMIVLLLVSEALTVEDLITLIKERPSGLGRPVR